MNKKFNAFLELVRDQFTYGAKKYGLKNVKDRESTDILFDTFGRGWLFGTICKYVFRFRNLRRERDMLKIATYSYLVWLKRGFFLDYKRVAPIDTNVELKEKYFPEFCKRAENFYKRFKDNYKGVSFEILLGEIERVLANWTNIEWKDLKEFDIFRIFTHCFVIWKRFFGGKKIHDTDTWLEGGKKK